MDLETPTIWVLGPLGLEIASQEVTISHCRVFMSRRLGLRGWDPVVTLSLRVRTAQTNFLLGSRDVRIEAASISNDAGTLVSSDTTCAS